MPFACHSASGGALACFSDGFGPVHGCSLPLLVRARRFGLGSVRAQLAAAVSRTVLRGAVQAGSLHHEPRLSCVLVPTVAVLYVYVSIVRLRLAVFAPAVAM